MARRDPATAALEALDRFIELWNSRDPHRFAQAMHYPHVRVSPRGEPVISPDASAYAAEVRYDQAYAMGWDHSRWDEKRVLHVSRDRVHAAGRWCRYDAQGRRLLPNDVVYVVTRIGDAWRIQARFGTDSEGASVDAAREAAERFVRAHSKRDLLGLAESAHFPLIEVDVGAVRALPDAERVVGDRGPLELLGIDAIQSGAAAANLSLDLRRASGERVRAVCMVARRGPDWGVRAISLLAEDLSPDPAAEGRG
jgi:hypothetical protein